MQNLLVLLDTKAPNHLCSIMWTFYRILYYIFGSVRAAHRRLCQILAAVNCDCSFHSCFPPPLRFGRSLTMARTSPSSTSVLFPMSAHRSHCSGSPECRASYHREIPHHRPIRLFLPWKAAVWGVCCLQRLPLTSPRTKRDSVSLPLDYARLLSVPLLPMSFVRSHPISFICSGF